MERKRDGFVPIGNVVAGVELPDGRTLTHAASAPRHHFTCLDQIDQLVDAFAAYLDTGSLRDAYRQRSNNEKATPSHRRDSQSASRLAAIREQRQRLREHLIQPGVL